MPNDNVGIVAFAFGTPHNLRSNIKLSKIAQRHAEPLAGGNFPIFTQADIVIENTYDVTYVHEKPGEPPSTLSLAREAIFWAIEKRIRTLHVIAAKPHMQRCLRDLKMAAEETGAEFTFLVPRSIKSSNWEWWFDRGSTQKHTRSVADWNFREKILSMMPVWLYKFVTGRALHT